MPDGEAGLRHQLAQAMGGVIYGAYAVVDEIDLTAPIYLAQDSVADEPVFVGGDVGFNRQAVLRRRIHRGHVAYA